MSFKYKPQNKQPEKEVVTSVEHTPDVAIFSNDNVEFEDRSAFNCPDCKGDGITGNIICNRCQGTGKI